MDANKLIVFPQNVLETMTIESTHFLPNDESNGVAILSQYEADHYKINVYQLLLSEDEKHYNFIQKLATFKYETQQDIDDFITHLPKMSALEMLHMLNPVPLYPTVML